jgi:hypothetical protein
MMTWKTGNLARSLRFFWRAAPEQLERQKQTWQSDYGSNKL